jgi:hypothetical protein
MLTNICHIIRVDGVDRTRLHKEDRMPNTETTSDVDVRGPSYRTCNSCHTRPAIGVANITGPDGEVTLTLPVCERCTPTPDTGWVDLYAPWCDDCNIYHSDILSCRYFEPVQDHFHQLGDINGI